MRLWLCTILFLLLLGGALGAYQWRRASIAHEALLMAKAIEARGNLEREIRIRAATGGATLNERGWPIFVDPAWFGVDPPLNPYVKSESAWLEIASPREADLSDPAIRQALTPDVAGLWYNPANGAVRVRVGSSITDSGAVDLYNRINGATVASLFEAGRTIERHPLRGVGARGATSRLTGVSRTDD